MTSLSSKFQLAPNWVTGMFESIFEILKQRGNIRGELVVDFHPKLCDTCELQTVWIFHYWNMICQSQWKLEISKFWKCRNQCSFFDSFDSDNGNKFYECDLVKFIIDSRCRCHHGVVIVEVSVSTKLSNRHVWDHFWELKTEREHQRRSGNWSPPQALWYLRVSDPYHFSLLKYDLSKSVKTANFEILKVSESMFFLWFLWFRQRKQVLRVRFSQIHHWFPL